METLPQRAPRSPRPASHPRTSGQPRHRPVPTGSQVPPPAYHHHAAISTFLTTSFLPSVVPSNDEYEAKEAARVLLEGFVERLWPGAQLRPFGSMANGFALKNSDMDLCCFLSSTSPRPPASECVEQLGRLIVEETNFSVKMLPRARIPIIKLVLPPTATVPFALACDIGFENRLALENTRLLWSYNRIDPRVRTMVLFLKVWTKRRQINSPYRGTLSSYGYVLLVIHFLVHVKNPPVLPNLQRIPPISPVSLASVSHDGHDIFFSDLAALPQYFQTTNTDSVGQLLIDFFRFYSNQFNYTKEVVSLRSETGFLPGGKEEKGWDIEFHEYDPEVIVRDLHKFCIEIRGEFMRAFKLLTSRPGDRITAVIADLCEERDDSLVLHPPDSAKSSPRRKSAPSSSAGTSRGGGSSGVARELAFNGREMQDFREWARVNVLPVQPVVTSGSGSGKGKSIEEATALYPPSSASSTSSTSTSASSSHPSSRRISMHPPTSPSSSFYPLAPSLERRVSWDGSGTSPNPNTNGLGVVNGQGGGAYDLHRFFQSPGSGSSGGHSASSGGKRTNLTAPSSPDLAAAGGLGFGLNGNSYGAGNYNYFGGGGSVGFGMGAGGSRPGRYTTVGPRMRGGAGGGGFGAGFDLPPPITFGNFPSNPLSPYSNSGIPFPSTSPSSPSFALPPTSSTPASIFTAERGRSGVEEREPRVRERGRSVPHVRVGEDGRESILFGEIAVVLPRPGPEVEGAVLNGAERDTRWSEEPEAISIGAIASEPTTS
ncbi:poly(U) polymerase CID1, partial [Pseudohyphozyma bogoriensis]